MAFAEKMQGIIDRGVAEAKELGARLETAVEPVKKSRNTV